MLVATTRARGGCGSATEPASAATLAALPDGDTLSFIRLQELIGLTPGNLITHLRKLEEVDYLASTKTGNGPASRTSVALTNRGRAALDEYTARLRSLLNGLQLQRSSWRCGTGVSDQAQHRSEGPCVHRSARRYAPRRME